MTVEDRINAALDRIEQMGAKAKRVLLTAADLPEMHGKTDIRGVPIAEGEIGGHSYIETENAPSGDTNFAL